MSQWREDDVARRGRAREQTGRPYREHNLPTTLHLTVIQDGYRLGQSGQINDNISS